MKTEQHQVTEHHHFFKECERRCFLSKNLYNKILFDLRQIYFHNYKVFKEGKGEQKSYPSYPNYHKLNKHCPDALAIGHSHLVQSIMKKAFENWKAFWAALSSYKKNPVKFKGRPRPPSYKDPQNGRFLTIYRASALSQRVDPLSIKLAATEISVPFINRKNCKKLCEVRIIPKLGYYVIEIVYEEYPSGEVPHKKLIASIDPGLNNLMTVVVSKYKFRPIIVNGRPVKALNAFYNKKIAKAKSKLPKGILSSRLIHNLWRRRENKIKNYLHLVTTRLADKLYELGVSRVIMGYNKDQKQNINLGKKTNQNFVMLPRLTVNSMLRYKLMEKGMSYIETEEAYTSKASALDGDALFTIKDPKRKGYSFSGRRLSRGLYRSSDKTLINADVNGAVNIMRKVIQNVPTDWIRGLVVTPVRLQLEPKAISLRENG